MSYVHCICAHWCDTCSEFRPLFDQLAGSQPQKVFRWHILEELEEQFPDIEVENFPMILIADASGKLQFTGPILPNRSALDHLLVATGDGKVVSRADELASWQAIAQALCGA